MNLGTLVVAGAVTVVSGLADAYGFVHASRMWDEGHHLVAFEWARSGIGFAVGILCYWFVVRLVEGAGVHSALVQTLGWFSVTVVGVALLDGDVRRWTVANQVVAGAVVFGIGWLLAKAGAQ
jgi:hypothetical protein